MYKSKCKSTRNGKNQGNVTPPEIDNSTAISSNESGVDKIPNQESKENT